MSGTILFYDATTPFAEFSNFFPCPITVDGEVFSSSEHYFQAMKFSYRGASEKTLEYSRLIAQQSTPGKCKNLATQKLLRYPYPWAKKLNELIEEYKDKAVINPEWDDVRDNVMRKIVYQKFLSGARKDAEHDKLKNLLLSTGDKFIIENTTKDDYWGCGTKKDGLNMLGKILVETRCLLSLPPVFTYDDPKMYLGINWLIYGVVAVSSLFSIVPSFEPDFIVTLVTEKECELCKTQIGSYTLKEVGASIYLNCPIQDQGVGRDETMLDLVDAIIIAIGLKRKILIRCLEGKGRSGVVAALVVGKLYSIGAEESFDIVARCFSTRPEKGIKCKKSPQTKVQFDQVRRLLK